MADSTKTFLEKSWKFTQIPSEQFPNVKEEYKSCSIPTSVHVELIKDGTIPDPYKGLNEWDVQCKLMFCQSRDVGLMVGVGEADWEFKTAFEYKATKHSQVDLVWEGLDTYCDVTLVRFTLCPICM